jgi:hypothetical protein
LTESVKKITSNASDKLAFGDREWEYERITQWLLGKPNPNPSQQKGRAERLAEHCLRYLILFAQKQSEETVAEIITPEKARELAAALVGKGSLYITGQHYKTAFEIAYVAVMRARETIPEIQVQEGNPMGPTIPPTIKRQTDEALGNLKAFVTLAASSKPKKNLNVKNERADLEKKNLQLKLGI